MNRNLLTWLAPLLLMLFAGCNGVAETASTPLTTGTLQPITGRDLRIVTGQVVYVPAYSEVFYGWEGLSIELGVTLAIHNSDLESPIVIQSVRYYNTDGELVRDYSEEPVEVSSLATTGFLVEEQDNSGGWGANFVVEWVAEEPVYEPVIEALMVSSRGTQGISMISVGRVLSEIALPELEGTPEATSDQ